MIKKKLKFTCIFFAVFLIIPVFASLSSAGEITIALQAAFPRTIAMEKMLPLMRYLEDDAGLKFKLITPEDSKDLIAKIGTGQIKMAFICGGHITRIKRKYKDIIRPPIVIGVGMDGKTTHRNQIIVHVDSDINDIQDVKGRKVEATAKYCLGGYIPQAAFFQDKGLNIPKETDLVFVRGYAKPARIMSDLILKKCDVGFIKDGMLKMLTGKINVKKLRVMATSPYDIPNWSFVVNKDLDKNIVKNIKESLLNLDPAIPEHKKILTGLSVSGFAEVKMEDFDIVTSLFDRLGI